MFEQISTKVVAKPILMPLTADEVVANVGHIPNNKTNVGFSAMIPFFMIFKYFIVRYI